MFLRDADCVHTTLGVALAGINTLVPDADVCAAALVISCALHQLATVFRISSVARTADTHCPVVYSAAVCIDATCRGVLTQVSAVGSSIDVNASRGWRAVSISVIANVWIMTSNASLLSVSVTNQVAGAPTDVASRIVFANGSVVTWVQLAFVRINTGQPAVVLVAQLALAEGLAVLHGARAVGPTLHPVTRAFTNEMNTLLIEGTVGIVKAVHLNTAPVLVIGVARVECTSRAGTLLLVIYHGARSIGATRLFFAWIDALGYAVLVTGCVQRAVRISSGTFARVGAAREAVSNEALGAAAHKAADRVLADAGGVARVVQAFIDIFTAVLHRVEARFAGAVVERAQLVNLAVAVRAAAHLAVAVDAEFPGRAVAVSRAGRHAEIVDTSLSNDAAAADSPAPVCNARQALGTGPRTCDHRPLAADNGRRVSSQAIRAVAAGFMVADLADGIRTAQALDLARVLAAILRAGLVQLAVAVLPAADLAVAGAEAGFFRRTVRVGEAGEDAAAVDALLARGAVGFPGAHQPALLINAGVAGRAVVVAEADDRLAAAAHGRVSPEVRLALAGGGMALRTAGRVEAALKVVAGVLAHGLSKAVGVAGQVAGAVPVPVGTGVGVAAALAVRVSDEAVGADALVAAGHVDALGRRVARVGVTVVNLLAPHQGVPGVARPAVADALVVLGHAASVHSTAVHAGVLAVEVWEAGLGDVAVFVLEALDLLAAFPLVVRVADVQAVGTGALGKMVVDHTHGPGCALEELAAVLTPALAVGFIKLADLVWMRAVSVVDALWFWNLLAASSAIWVSCVALSAAATALVVERDTVCVRRAAEADANLSTLHDTNGVGNASRGCWAASVVAAFVVLPLDAGEHVFSISNKAMSALAFIGVLPRDTQTVGPTLVELASIEAPLAARVVSPTNVSEPPAVFVDLAFVLRPASVNRVVWVSLVVLQTVARWPVVVHAAHGIGAALLPFAGIDALAAVSADLVGGTLVVRGAAFGDRLSGQAGNVRIEGISLCSRRACTLSLVVYSRAKCIGGALLIHAHRDTFPQASCVRSTNEVLSAVDVDLAFVWNVTASDQWVPNQARFADTSRSVVHRLTNGPTCAVVTFASVVAVVLAIKYPLADGNGRTVVVPVASLGLAVTSIFSVVRVSDEVLSALADGNVVFSVADAVLTAQCGGAARKTALDAVAVNSTDLVVPAVAAGAAFRNRGAAISDVVGETLEPGPALAAGFVMDRDAVCVWTTAPVPARVCAVPDTGASKQAHR